ncbi:protein translocase subunit SecD [Vibrio marisflavi]|uniref:Protein translocase subunit SecD n=1 Tax=Vibrio marisflavi CECT 7928 TaxID=634439 RepID=A0ABN8E4N5_9VIBR|nr:protein translocase subunit SecD [Vibrio marisflavi]CAH0536993.1 Protein translocase subunit SecD [Vibrio marisflavi CECT 7928]
MKNNKRIINHYSKWKYVFLIVTVVILGLSAIPTWYGEQPSIQLTMAHPNEAISSVAKMAGYLKEKNIDVDKITQKGEKTTLIFNNENDQTLARQALDPLVGKKDTITYSFVSVAPQWLTDMGFAPIKLGLDLRGGVQFLLNVDVDKAFSEQRDTMVDDIRDMLSKSSVYGVRFKNDTAVGFDVTSNDSSALNKVQNYIQSNYSGWSVKHYSDKLTVVPTKSNREEFQNATVTQNLKIMRDRIEQLGITEALVQRQGANKILIDLPGVQDPTKAKKIIGATASLAFHEVIPSTQSITADDIVLKNNEGQNVVLNRRPVLTGEHIINARANVDKMGMAEVDISLDHAGGKLMSQFSGTHIGKPMATVYREYQTNAKGQTERKERVISVATIQSKLGSQFRITGAGSLQQAQQLALLLRAGSLTAPVTIVAEQTIGASLGAENIHNGFAALALGMGLTLTFMALWYRRLGWVADVALLINMVSLIGLIALLPGAVLTLPGIAGLVLTVGMAVDTNVLIFERIRDKLREGRSLAQAIDQGFSTAFATILDANVTTMITAVILYSIGNGPIAGFAMTLGLGLLTSMFTGVFASRAIINLVWGRDGRRGLKV